LRYYCTLGGRKKTGVFVYSYFEAYLANKQAARMAATIHPNGAIATIKSQKVISTSSAFVGVKEFTRRTAHSDKASGLAGKGQIENSVNLNFFNTNQPG
jgi:hypothetical protein